MVGWQLLPSNGKYNVKEAYLEAVVPLGLGIELNGAARVTDYSSSGTVTTWKVGATWQLTEDVRFRVTRSRDIRARTSPTCMRPDRRTAMRSAIRVARAVL